MSIIDSVKNTAFSTAVKTVMDYLEKDPEKNIPKAMSMMDKVLPDGWYEGQRAAFRKAIAEKGNWYQLIMKAYQLDAGVRKTFFQNFIVNSCLLYTSPVCHLQVRTCIGVEKRSLSTVRISDEADCQIFFHQITPLRCV